MLARAAGLSGDGRQLLEVAALTGARVEPRLLEVAAPCSPAAVDALLASGLLAALYDDPAAELSLLDRAAEAAGASRHALELWQAAGDRRREGDTMRRLSCILWHLCRGEEAEATAERAVAVLESLPPGVELAQAYANLATQHMVRGRHHSAIEHARRAQSIAAQASSARRTATPGPPS